jgi:formate-dependent nitrite reductase membrane component NrfD
MSGDLPSTWFTSPAQWQWLIILYFFVGGLAGGSFFIGALIDLFGRVEDRPLARLGYYVAFPAVLVSGVLLILDLGRPLRFWHMMIESNTWQPMFKWYSPMSVGSWALLLFGAFSLAALLAALADTRRVRWSWAARLRPPGIAGTLVAVLGGALGFFVASYTGVLLAVTNRPIWADTTLLGLNFLVSAASTSAALMILLAWRGRWHAMPGVHALGRFDSLVLVLELVALVALVVSLGAAARAFLNVWGVLLVLGVVVPGIVLPLILHARARRSGRDLGVPAASLLVLLGGFLLRVVIVLASETTGLPV